MCMCVICKKYLVVLFSVVTILSCQKNQPNTRLNAIVVDVIGHEFNWYFRYPGQDGVLGSDDDQHSTRHLYLPDNAQVKLQLKSKDYLYSLALPDLQLKEIAVPEMVFELNFNSGNEGTMQLLGDQFCGYTHKTLIGQVRVVNQDKGFYKWLR